jgi:hypothetical protein
MKTGCTNSPRLILCARRQKRAHKQTTLFTILKFLFTINLSFVICCGKETNKGGGFMAQPVGSSPKGSSLLQKIGNFFSRLKSVDEKVEKVSSKSDALKPQVPETPPSTLFSRRKAIIELRPQGNLLKSSTTVQQAATQPLHFKASLLPPVKEAAKYLLDAITEKLEMPKSQETDKLAKDFLDAISAKLRITNELTQKEEEPFKLGLLNAVAGALQVQPLNLPATMPKLKLPKGQEKEFVMELVQVITEKLGPERSKKVWDQLGENFPRIVGEKLGVTLFDEEVPISPERGEVQLASDLIRNGLPLKSMQILKYVLATYKFTNSQDDKTVTSFLKILLNIPGDAIAKAITQKTPLLSGESKQNEKPDEIPAAVSFARCLVGVFQLARKASKDKDFNAFYDANKDTLEAVGVPSAQGQRFLSFYSSPLALEWLQNLPLSKELYREALKTLPLPPLPKQPLVGPSPVPPSEPKPPVTPRNVQKK